MLLEKHRMALGGSAGALRELCCPLLPRPRARLEKLTWSQAFQSCQAAADPLTGGQVGSAGEAPTGQSTDRAAGTVSGGSAGEAPQPPAAARAPVGLDRGRAAWLTKQHFSFEARGNLSCGFYLCQETAPNTPGWASAGVSGGQTPAGRRRGENPAEEVRTQHLASFPGLRGPPGRGRELPGQAGSPL